MRSASLAIGFAALAACAVDTSSQSDRSLAHGTAVGLDALVEQSCPDDESYALPEKVAITVTPIESIAEDGAAFRGLDFVAGFELTSDDDRFGGLSGLEFLDHNTLLAVSDFGTLFWIDFEEDAAGGLSLATSAYATRLKDADGETLSRKTNLDAEAIDWNGERLLVSFERNHRILAYDLEGCGANARGMPVLSFDTAKADGVNKIESNRGMEALATTSDGSLVIGVETPGQRGPVYALHTVGAAPLAFTKPLPMVGAQLLTGADKVSTDNGNDRLYTVHRSYDPLTGNQVSVVKTDPETDDSTILGTLKKPGLVDNFEGIAVTDNAETTRIAIVSDDNFSARQKTLLFFFDETKP